MNSEFIENLFDLRRSAYIDALMSMRQSNNVIGTFGEGIDEAIFYAFKMVRVPIIGVDGYVFQYGEYEACDPVKSTMIYMQTDKCPLLYSSCAFVIKSKCTPMIDAFILNARKPVHCYSNEEDFKKFLEQLTENSFDPQRYKTGKDIINKIGQIIDNIRNSSISGYEFSILKFYSDYILDIEKRLTFLKKIESNFIHKENIKRLKINVCCPRGLMGQIRKKIQHDNFEIFEVDGDADFSCKRCTKNAMFKINY